MPPSDRLIRPGPQRYAVAGLGVTRQGVIPDTSAEQLAWQAVELALADSGLSRRAVNGYVFQPGFGENTTGMAASRAALAANVTLQITSSGATAILAVASAIGLIAAGMAEYVVCVHATNARSQAVTVGEGEENAHAAFGLYSPGAHMALSAQRYLARYGRESADLGAFAVALRAHGALRDDAFCYGQPITLDEHQASRYVVRPMRLYDYCLVTDGAIAFIVTTAERARDLARPPVAVLGLGASHDVALASAAGAPRGIAHADFDAGQARTRAFGQAGLGIGDIDVCQFYDAFTILVAQQIEAYGLCAPGEAPDWLRAGHFGYASPQPCNTSGTLHSWGYVQGFTHVAEAVRQLRGEGGATQVARAETALVTNIGLTGAGQAHCAMILGRV